MISRKAFILSSYCSTRNNSIMKHSILQVLQVLQKIEVLHNSQSYTVLRELLPSSLLESQTKINGEKRLQAPARSSCSATKVLYNEHIVTYPLRHSKPKPRRQTRWIKSKMHEDEFLIWFHVPCRVAPTTFLCYYMCTYYLLTVTQQTQTLSPVPCAPDYTKAT